MRQHGIAFRAMRRAQRLAGRIVLAVMIILAAGIEGHAQVWPQQDSPLDRWRKETEERLKQQQQEADRAARQRDDEARREVALKSVVVLTARLAGGPTTGAGIVFGRAGGALYVVTANHVVRRGNSQAQDIVVGVRARSAQRVPASLTSHADAVMDLAVIAVPSGAEHGLNVCAWPFDVLGDANALKRGDPVYPVGNPNGVPWGMPVMPDRIAQVSQDGFVFQSTLLSAGHSGGAVLGEHGDLLGLIQTDQPPFGLALKLGMVLDRLRAWGYPVHLRAQGSSPPLHEAVRRRDVTLVKRLVAECGKTQANTMIGGRTPLHLAVALGQAEVVGVLLAAGADVNARGTASKPLHIAVERGDVEMAKFLIAQGANVNPTRSVDAAALHVAARRGDVAMVRLLLGAGAAATATDSRYGTVLHIGVEGQANGETVRLLLGAGAQVRARDRAGATALHVAAARGNMTAVTLLIDAGADINALDGRGETPLDYAVRRGEIKTAALIGDRGGAMSRKASDAVNDMLVEAVQEGHVRIVRLMLANGADPNPGYTVSRDKHTFGRSSTGDSLLHVATRRGEPGIVRLLLEAGARVTAADQHGNLPLHDAAQRGALEIIRLLLQSGADISAKNSKGETALDAALQARQKAAADLLRSAAAPSTKR